MDNLGVGGTGNRGEEFSVSESVFPGPQLFIQPEAGAILYNSVSKKKCKSAVLKWYRNDSKNVQKIKIANRTS